MRVIVGCEESGEVRDAFIKLGHDAISCDLKPARNGGPHYQGDIFDIDFTQFDLAIIHPPCTYLCVTANKWLKDQPLRKSGVLVGVERRNAVKDAHDFFINCCPNCHGCIIWSGFLHNVLITPTGFSRHNFFTGNFHKEPKKTCLWLRGLPLLKPTKIVEPEYHTTKSGKRLPKWYAYADKSKGQAHRAEIRSKTFSVVAEAMAYQWTKNISPVIEINFESNGITKSN